MNKLLRPAHKTMQTWKHSIPQKHRLRVLFLIIMLGFTALASIHFALHKLTTDKDKAAGKTRIRVNLLHHLSEEIKGVQTLYFIWPTITDPPHRDQVHVELNNHIDQIFQSIRILEHGGPVPKDLIPPDLFYKSNSDLSTHLSPSEELDLSGITALKTNLQSLFGDIEYLNRLLQSQEEHSSSAVLTIQQTDSELFASLYGITRSLIHDTKQYLGAQQQTIIRKQSSYMNIEIILIILTLCTVCFLTWRATRQLISSSNLRQDTSIQNKNEIQRHQALNAILMISMEKRPLQQQLEKSLQILIKLMTSKGKETTGAIFVVDHKKQQITLSIKQGVPDDLACFKSYKDFSTCLCGTCHQSGEIMHQEENQFSECSADKKLYCIPIGPQNQVMGVLLLGFSEANPSHEEITFLKFVTPILAGIILENQYEQELSKSELATLSIFQGSDQAILLIRDNEIMDWNDGAATLFKATSLQEFQATDDLQKLLPANAPTTSHNAFTKLIKTALTTGVSHRELRLSKQDGSLFLASLTLTTIPLHGEHIIYLVIHDISAKEAEQQALIHAKDDAEKASSAKSTFLTTMSHEILTPLNAILGITALTMTQELTTKTRENLEIIQTSSQSLKALVTDILDISKIDADQFTAITIPFSIRTIATSLLKSFEEEACQHDILFTITTDPNTPDNLLGDPSRLQQVLSKLIKNGFKYTKQGAVTITISCKKKSTTSCCILFTIQDTGIGIEQSNLETVFNDFTQVTSSATGRYGGVGLGLTISKKIVEKMGGTIWATSTPNQGSSFYVEITFPLFRPLNTAEQFTQTKTITSVSGKRVLVVEDSPINLKVTSQTLKGMGIEVFEATNGKEGVAAMSTDFDAVLMDVEMPIMDGITATENIRKNPKYSHIPIIAITAHGINADKNLCLRAGMNDYMTKPLEPEVLLQVLSRNINSRDSRTKGAIDFDAGIAKVGGDQEFFNEILQDFCGLHGDEGELLSKLFTEKAFNEIRERAHRLKGVAGTISANNFTEKAEHLEELTRAELIDPNQIKTAILELKSCITDVLETIGCNKNE